MTSALESRNEEATELVLSKRSITSTTRRCVHSVHARNDADIEVYFETR